MFGGDEWDALEDIPNDSGPSSRAATGSGPPAALPRTVSTARESTSRHRRC